MLFGVFRDESGLAWSAQSYTWRNEGHRQRGYLLFSASVYSVLSVVSLLQTMSYTRDAGGGVARIAEWM